jgi:holo-[acyl-carrier protein] synthase
LALLVKLSKTFSLLVVASMISRMDVLAHGIDMVSCDRLREAIERHGERFLRRVFTKAELEYCSARRRRIEHLAGRFAAKEAVMKVLGTGWGRGINWTDIETRNLPSGQPAVSLKGVCRKIADEMGLEKIFVSVSHIHTHAIASAIGAGRAGAATGPSREKKPGRRRSPGRGTTGRRK